MVPTSSSDTPSPPSPSADAAPALAAMRGLRQSRRFLADAVPRADLEQLLEVARWTGSAKNTQPWHLVVVTDRDINARLAETGGFTRFLDGVAASIVIAVDGDSRSVPYDEGRLSERVMLAASHLGIGSGTAWFSTDAARGQVRDLLGIPDTLHPWSAIGLGYTDRSQEQASPQLSGRRPLADVGSWGRFGDSA